MLFLKDRRFFFFFYILFFLVSLRYILYCAFSCCLILTVVLLLSFFCLFVCLFVDVTISFLCIFFSFFLLFIQSLSLCFFILVLLLPFLLFFFFFFLFFCLEKSRVWALPGRKGLVTSPAGCHRSSVVLNTGRGLVMFCSVWCDPSSAAGLKEGRKSQSQSACLKKKKYLFGTSAWASLSNLPGASAPGFDTIFVSILDGRASHLRNFMPFLQAGILRCLCLLPLMKEGRVCGFLKLTVRWPSLWDDERVTSCIRVKKIKKRAHCTASCFHASVWLDEMWLAG